MQGLDDSLVKQDGKVFNFKHGITVTLTLNKLFKIYDKLNRLDYKLLKFLYLSSERYREYMKTRFPEYFSYLIQGSDGYEDNVESSLNTLLFDVDNRDFETMGLGSEDELDTVVDALIEFIDVEMGMWIKWAFNKHVDTQKPVHLIRYMVGTSII